MSGWLPRLKVATVWPSVPLRSKDWVFRFPRVINRSLKIQMNRCFVWCGHAVECGVVVVVVIARLPA
jgi:hypothetical protein